MSPPPNDVLALPVPPQAHTLTPGADAGCPGFGHWLCRLQGAWYANQPAACRDALSQADFLLGPSVAPAERMRYHVFAVLVLTDSAAPALALEPHYGRLASLCEAAPADAPPLAVFADAILRHRQCDQLGALRGYESVAADASRTQMPWLVALAWEQAARLAQDCGLGAAMQHYRVQAVNAYQGWGAHGRMALLLRRWPDAARALAVPDGALERLFRAGTVGELSLSIAHEVNQPLAAISLHAAAARKWLRKAPPDIERALSSIALISDAGRHAGDIVRSVQQLAASEQCDITRVHVDQTIAETLKLLHRQARRHGIAVELALGLGDCHIDASRVQLQQIITNLVVNAIEALAAHGAPSAGKRIGIASRHHGERDVEISISDNGPGIALHDRDRIFGSLFSTKADGTGMGLSISLAIVRAHGGHIGYEPVQPNGACFRFRLPKQSRAHGPAVQP